MKQTRYARANSIIRKFSQASLASKIVLFKAYCTPMYGCQLWSSSFQYSLNKLKVAYNDWFRLLLNEPRWCSASSLFVYHIVPTFDALIRKLIYALPCGVVVTIVLMFWLINCSHQTFIMSLNYLNVGASYCTNVVFCCFLTFIFLFYTIIFSLLLFHGLFCLLLK